MFRAFGRTGEDLHKEHDQQVYNDFDFYQNLLEDFLQQHEHDALDAGSDMDEAEKAFLGNTDISLT